MRRGHRSVHRVLWPVLAMLVILGLAAALWLRPEPVTSDQKPVISILASDHWSPITGH
jgi:cytochrome c oxidase assembly factor CtaG